MFVKNVSTDWQNSARQYEEKGAAKSTKQMIKVKNSLKKDLEYLRVI